MSSLSPHIIIILMISSCTLLLLLLFALRKRQRQAEASEASEAPQVGKAPAAAAMNTMSSPSTPVTAPDVQLEDLQLDELSLDSSPTVSEDLGTLQLDQADSRLDDVIELVERYRFFQGKNFETFVQLMHQRDFAGVEELIRERFENRQQANAASMAKEVTQKLVFQLSV